MSKYSPLKAWLAARADSTIPTTFGEIESVLGFRLPSSKSSRAWWSNNPSNNVMTREWLAAGYETEQVDIVGEKLVFRKVGHSDPAIVGLRSRAEPSGMAERTQARFENEGSSMDDVMEKTVLGAQILEKFYAEMGGLVTFAPGFDPADPWADEEWPDPELPEAQADDGGDKEGRGL